jgi:hypothetical protein
MLRPADYRPVHPRPLRLIVSKSERLKKMQRPRQAALMQTLKTSKGLIREANKA